MCLKKMGGENIRTYRDCLYDDPFFLSTARTTIARSKWHMAC